MDLKEIFDKYKNVAVYGMSGNPSKAAHTVPAFFIDRGYNIFPINPKEDEIKGRKVYRSILDIPDEINILNVFRPSEEAYEVVREAVERKNQNGDIDLIWLQEGIVNEDARKLAEENGMEFIQDRCMFKEYNRL